MSKSLNKIPFSKIEKYVLGKMEPAQKNAFEKQALKNPLLQEAIDGYESNHEGLNYFKTHLKFKYKKNQLLNYILFSLLGLLLVGGVLIWKYNSNINHQTIAKTKQSNNQNTNKNKEVEVLPFELDTLSKIESKQQIKHQDIIITQNQKEKFNQIQSSNQNNQKIHLLDVDEPEEQEVVETIERQKVKAYPFVYFYDIAVVDYTKYENRTQIMQKTTYVFSGTEASYENVEDKQMSELIQQKIDVPYMKYLEEAIYYFSNSKYKNALKRFQVINQQYDNDLNALFYGGLSNYNLGRFHIALKDFTKIINLNQNPFYEDALWYRAKTYMQLNQKSNAKSDLENLALISNYYQKQALQQLKKISE